MPRLSFQSTQTIDERAFLQERVARFALFFGLIAFGTWLATVLIYTAQGKPENVWALSSIFHISAGFLMLGVWGILRRPNWDKSTLLVIETVGIMAGASAVALAALEIKLVQRPELIMIFALTQLLVLRAALIPSTARHTALIAALVGAVIVPMTYVRYLGEPGFLAAAETERSLGWVTAFTAVWWLVTACSTTLISWVIYGLRMDIKAAQRLGHYTLDERLGKGGMGEVWRATHGLLRRPAAIKLIRPEALRVGDEKTRDVVSRFEREAQATATLQSPHTVELYDFGVSEDGVLYHVIELLAGVDLFWLVERFGPLPPERAVFVLQQLCDSLDDAHRSGLVHRDIKPPNIFLSRRGRRFDYVKVLDFGLVRIPSQSGTGDELDRGMAIGTPGYMAPEMLFADPDIDGRADIYSFGCTAYWLLTGREVFEKKDARELAMAHINDTVIPPSKRASQAIPPELDAVVLACLEKNRKDRPKTIFEVYEMLRKIELEKRWSNRRAHSWWLDNLEEELTQRLKPPEPGLSRTLRPARH